MPFFFGGTAGGGGLFSAYAYLRDEKPSGTQGGDGVGVTWNTRTLNTEVFDPSGIVTLAANQFTLQAGTYFISARAPTLFVGRTRTRIRNITAGSTAGLGSSTFNDSGAVTSSPDCWVQTRVTIAGATVFELQHFITASAGFGVGFGTPTTTGETEVYAEVWIWKEA